MSAAPRTPPAESLPAFVRANAAWLGAGAMMTFGSSFGQTFFIALFAGEIRAEFGLSHGAWGAICTLGTLGAAAAMLWAGGLTDRVRARTLALGLLVLFAGVCAFTALAWSPVALGFAVFGLRFCGQGMLHHTAIVSMGRWFARARGRAVAMANLGIAAGEGAWWPEVYGTRNLGGIRSMAASAMVFATAVGPGATGVLIDLGVGFEAQLVGMAAIALGMAGLFAYASGRAGREAGAPSSASA